MDLASKRVLVLGLGVHGGGLGVTRWLLKQGANVTVTDLKTPDELKPTLDALDGQPVRYVLGEHRAEDVLGSDLIVRGPGVPRESPWLTMAQEHNIPVEMEMGLFFEQLPRGDSQVVGITGTKGKTTTTLMVGAILTKASDNIVVAGNLRVSAVDLLPKINRDTIVVLELSSWQLEGLVPHQTSPHIAAITNISPDHLNRYRSFDDYAESKAIIFRYQQPGDYVVLNFDNPILTRLSHRAFSRVVWTSATRPLKEGAFRDGSTLYWAWQGHRVSIMGTHQLQVPGAHNVENALAAIAIASIWGATPEQIADALKDFRGAEHRQELVRELDSVRYVDDTTATAPAAAMAAIQALRPTAAHLILIAGGSDKGLDFTALANEIARYCKYVLLLDGTATDKLEGAIKSQGVKDLIVGRYSDMQAAVESAHNLARAGDVVLLSPGCASFGMFANEFERGDTFRRLVASLEPMQR